MNFTPEGLYGLMAEFHDANALLSAAERARDAGYQEIEAYAPFPVPGLAAALGFRSTRLPQLVLAGGILGAVGGFGLQYWVSAIAYPLNVGGRPLNSWPSFLPVTFEFSVLVAAFAAVLGMLALNGLPQPWHPLFAVDRFRHATQDRFFLVIQATDPQFHRKTTGEFLEQLHACGVCEVEL